MYLAENEYICNTITRAVIAFITHTASPADNIYSMKEDLKRILKGIQSGINYISEDIEAICDETMLEYAQDALNDLTEAEERIKALIEKQD